MRQHIHWSHTNELPYTLNLSEGFVPFTSQKTLELPFKKFTFAGGERHLQIEGDPSTSADNSTLIITQRVADIGDLYDILLANDAAKRMGFKKVHLILPCFPGARQDRVCNQGEALTVKLNADLINSCGFETVTIYSPHSDVTPAVINNVIVQDNDHHYILRIIAELGYTEINIVCPDAGAGKRVLHIVQEVNAGNSVVKCKADMIRCEKIRDVKNGKITDIIAHVDDLKGAPCIIADDIVVYGGTFLGIAEKLREKNCGPLSIFTSHADCQKGLDKLAEVFDHVYTTNSKGDWAETDKIKVFKFEV